MDMPAWYASIRLPLLFLQAVVGMQLFGYPLHRRKHLVLRVVMGLTVAFLVTGLCGQFCTSGESRCPPCSPGLSVICWFIFF